MLLPPPRVLVTGVPVNALTLTQARELLLARARARKGGYVCFCDVNSLSWARRDPSHRKAIEKAFLATPDGMPVVWLCQRLQNAPVTRVYGPDVLQEICAATAGTELSHFFYGAAPGVATSLVSRLQARYPGLNVVGIEAPPFRELSETEQQDLVARLTTLRPDFVWVGLGTPKQERFMARFSPDFTTGVFLGVGAAFDFLSGNVRHAPRWIQRSGLEWLFRLACEPARLAPRYFRNNPVFALRAILQLSRRKRS